MTQIWTLAVFLLTLQQVFCLPAASRSNDISQVLDLEKNDAASESVNASFCKPTLVALWAADFHDCFMDRKYKDGGENLETIVDRILDHAEKCAEKSQKECLLDFEGFLKVTKKFVEQIQDYSSMYLNDVPSYRDKVKDLKCVESLKSSTYETCFRSSFSNSSQTYSRNLMVEGLTCCDQSNGACSAEAKKSLRRLVASALGDAHLANQVIEPTTPPPKKKEEEWRWYDYIIQPFVQAWNAIKNFFG